MGAYDIATKVILTHCKKAALEFFLGLSVGHCDILELPQETVSLSRADFPIRVVTTEGEELVVLLELQSRWDVGLPLRLLGYEVRYRQKTGLPVEGAVILLTPSKTATDLYEAGGIRYRFRLVSLAELDAREVMESGQPCLTPFVPLMKGGRELFDEAEALLYSSELPRPQRSDLLTGMALLSGLIAEDLPRRLLERRRDIIMENVAYEMIKNEGIQQGIQQGMIQDARELVLEAVMERFGRVPPSLEQTILKISSRMTLKDLFRKVLRSKTLEEFEAFLPASQPE